MAGKKLTFGFTHPKDCKCWLCRGEAHRKQSVGTEPPTILNSKEDKKEEAKK